jgi:hypothetical protein
MAPTTRERDKEFAVVAERAPAPRPGTVTDRRLAAAAGAVATAGRVAGAIHRYYSYCYNTVKFVVGDDGV